MYPCTVTLTSDVDIRIYQFEGPSFASNGFLTCEAPNGFPWFKWFGSVENTLQENIRHRHPKMLAPFASARRHTRCCRYRYSSEHSLLFDIHDPSPATGTADQLRK